MALIKFVVVVVVLVCMFVSGDATQVGCIKREREALLSFKDGLIDDYDVLSSWRSDDCCKWYGVECENTTGHVVALQLDAANFDIGVLRGKVGSSLLELHHLNYLDLSENDFGGNPIPEFISSMKQLQHLYLSKSNFSGIVPPQIGSLTKLISLDLSYNSLMRIAENPDWLSSSLSFLSFLDLSGFDLSHTNRLHHILSLPSLHELQLRTCNLTDVSVKPPSNHLFANSSCSTSLSILILRDNHFTFSSFDWLSNMNTSLVRLDLSSNALSGPIPNEFERSITLIQHLDLSSNMLEGGQIPKSLCNLSHLRVLVLYNNHFKGHFHELFGNLSGSGNGILESLQILDLARNQLKGSVPEELRAFSALTEVYLGENYFTGSMPISLGQLSRLIVLDISRNSLEGTVSESHFIKLDSLKVLDLSFNSGLKWHVAPDWIPPFQLDFILLRGCNVGPSFPKWIQTQRNFTTLDLSSAGIKDEAPKWLWSISPVLENLFLSHNQISGTIPDLSSTKIVGLDLAYNNFSGPIPLLNGVTAYLALLNGNKLSGSISSLCEIIHDWLRIIDLSDNELGGEVPNCWEKMPKLFSLNLDGNSFWGEIPLSLGSLGGLFALQLRGNNFSGELPSTLRFCQQLTLLDVGGNQLTGEIPDWIGDMHGMWYLNLGRNNLHGSIPPQICNLADIRIMDLSVNNLSGEIPNCFTNFTELAQKSINPADLAVFGYMYTITYNPDLPNVNEQRFYAYSWFQWKGQESEYGKNLKLLKLIDLSSNRLSGNIPESVSSMRGLISLNLSRNSLTGNIIPAIGEMEMLECLDLSHNLLSGKIPASTAKLHLLAVLDLSNNSLSGKIPTSTQLQSFNASAYAANGGLCGPPLASCPEDSLRPPSDNNPPGKNTKHDEIFSFVQEVCISMAFGFILGFWGLVASFLLKRSWRIAYFNLLDAAGDWFYVRAAIFLSKWRKIKLKCMHAS